MYEPMCCVPNQNTPPAGQLKEQAASSPKFEAELKVAQGKLHDATETIRTVKAAASVASARKLQQNKQS